MKTIAKEIKITKNEDIKKRKPKGSILDPFFSDIKYYYDLGLNVIAITKLMNTKKPISMSSTAYRHFIKTKIVVSGEWLVPPFINIDLVIKPNILKVTLPIYASCVYPFK